MQSTTNTQTIAELPTRTVNGHTQYTIDTCGKWSWSLFVTPTDTDFRGTVKAIKPVKYDGAIYKTNGEQPNKATKNSTHQLEASEVVKLYVERSDTGLTEAELWNRITAAFDAEGVEPEGDR